MKRSNSKAVSAWHRPWPWLSLAIAIIVLGSPNRVLHWYPAALVGIAPLFYWSWDLPLRQCWRYAGVVWLGVCALVFLPNPLSVPALTTAEVLAGAAVSPIVPLYFTTATVLGLGLTRHCRHWRYGLWLRPLAIAAVWTGFDGFFAVLQFPLPLHYGASLFDGVRAIQIADVTGIWGVTFVAVATNAAIAAACRARLQQCWQPLAGVALLWLATLTYGSVQLSQYADDTFAEANYRIGTIQQVAWLEADSSWSYRWQRYRDLEAYSRVAIAAGADLLVWPEGALRAQVEGMPPEADAIAPLLPLLPVDGGLIAGSSEPAPGSEELPWDERIYVNSALLYGTEGEVRDRYGKQWLFQYFETARFVPSPGGYRPLDGGERLGKLGVSICLESVLPRASGALVRAGAQSLVTLSDDSWFGWSNWPTLHGLLSVFRAVETRRSFAFTNNTGGNAIVAPSGKLVAWGPFWQRGEVMGEMQIRDEMTIATRWGDWFVWVCLVATSGLVVSERLGRDRSDLHS